jgi:hypothetical protein
MTIYNASLLSIDLNELKRYAVWKETGARADSMLHESVRLALSLIKPKASWHIYEYDSCSHSLSGTDFTLPGSAIVKHLASSIKVACLAVTIGTQLEEMVSIYFNEGKYSLGLLLDAAGTVAVETAADQIMSIIPKTASPSGLVSTKRFSPGYGDLMLDVQPYMLTLSQAPAIDISITSAYQLVPRKSITAFVGLLPYHNPDSSRLVPCQSCLKKNCNYRNTSMKGE